MTQMKVTLTEGKVHGQIDTAINHYGLLSMEQVTIVYKCLAA